MSLVKYILVLGVVVTVLSGRFFGKIWPNQNNQLKSSSEKNCFLLLIIVISRRKMA
ncbi:hypothetical protein HUE58_00685 [Candidatus Ruthia endofausta]|uniref:Uncharacterized protein n=1 Tax=Candidatus Ruthia endofausta TaxID=2738852 RepID=A0A6N0HN27_9GAMM|nr:hypothetical protein [Candidatus Ruthia endofausta]QKQ23744.1 hypothetical protein HUE58_00685 [Candidatus Ruthia endofausta]